MTPRSVLGGRHLFAGTTLLMFLLCSGGSQANESNLRISPVPKLTEGPVATNVVVRVVAHGSLALGENVGGARVKITDVQTGKLLASGIQQGEAGDQNQIMRTPHLMKEPIYGGRTAAAFRTTLHLDRPTLVEVSAEGPLGYPRALQRAEKTVILIPGQDMHSEGIVIDLSGYIVQIQKPRPGMSLIAKDDVKLVASVRTLSGSLVRPHGDWDSRKVTIYGELLIGKQVVQRLQLFYSGDKSDFEAPFFVPTPKEAPDGITLRVLVADGARGNFGLGEATYPVLPEEAKLRKRNQ